MATKHATKPDSAFEWPPRLPQLDEPCTLCSALSAGFDRVVELCKARAEEIDLNERGIRKVKKGLTQMREVPAMFAVLHHHSAEPIKPRLLSAQLTFAADDPEAFILAYL